MTNEEIPLCGATGTPTAACRHCQQRRADQAAVKPKKPQAAKWAGRMRVRSTSVARDVKRCALFPDEHLIRPRDLQTMLVHFYGHQKQVVGLVCPACAEEVRRRKGRAPQGAWFNEHRKDDREGRYSHSEEGKRAQRQADRCRALNAKRKQDGL